MYFALWWALLYVFVFGIHKLYQMHIASSKIEELFSLIRYGFYWFLFYTVWVYLWNNIFYSWPEIPRGIIIYATILGISFSFFIRIFLNILQSYLLKRWYVAKRTIILLISEDQKEVKNYIKDISQSGIYEILWYANTKAILWQYMPYLWDYDTLKKNIIWKKCDELLYLGSDFSKKELYNIWQFSRIAGTRYRYAPNTFDITKTNTTLSLIYKNPVLEIIHTPLENWNRVFKRIFDIVFSIFFIIITFPFWIIIGWLIKYGDPSGPVIYKNLRVWQNGKVFHCYKFRYLFWKYSTKESYGEHLQDENALKYEKELIQAKNTRNWPLYKIKNDPRKTPIGSFLEKYSLDEIPQFLNILKGDMSLVWPRPHQPREVEKYQLQEKRLLTIKPWLTGMAQVHGREKNSFSQEAKLDMYYIENWSFILDIKIVLKTLQILLFRK